jgi:aspartate/methionine/tyrosine aminotransferase
MKKTKSIKWFRDVPNTGVIYVMEEAAKRGFSYGNPEWSNLGQGAPETRPLDSEDKRLTSIPVDSVSSEYAPVSGLKDLRQAIADLYNERYRKNKISKYTYENVSISPGGRSGLTRVIASLDSLHLGHYLPDYTAYEELFDAFKRFIPIPIVLKKEEDFRITADHLAQEIQNKGLGAVLLSNPNNPTGQLLYGEELEKYVKTAKRYKCALIIDEFYSHYIYKNTGTDHNCVSSAEYVEDVNRDAVIIVDGLTKNWRYPGLRLSWTLAPKDIIQKISSAGSFLDGGASHPIQLASMPLIKSDIANRHALDIQNSFVDKKNFAIKELKSMGFNVPADTSGAFYVFAEIVNGKFKDSHDLFQRALDKKLILIPGDFFDVNPGMRRSHIPSRLSNHFRVSFGPSMGEVVEGMRKLKSIT